MDAVTRAYAVRADEYTAVLGSMAAVHADDRTLVEEWAATCEGTVLDAGCGPGHWTAHLHGRGHTVVGVDAVPGFVEHAERTAQDVAFRSGDLDALPFADAELGGVLSWYSVIHHRPDRIGVPIGEFHRVLRPGGRLLVGFFDGAEVEPFDHAVTTAYRWPVSAFARVLEGAGFEVVHAVRRDEPGTRPHAAISAVRVRAANRG